MYLDILIAQRKWTKYQLSKQSQIPYATLNDLFSEKTSLLKCNSETLYKLSKTFGISMEDLLMQTPIKVQNMKRIDFELFKSNLQHQIKVLGHKSFIKEMLKED